MHHAVDMGGHLAPDDGPDEAHQPLRFAQLTRRMASTTSTKVSWTLSSIPEAQLAAQIEPDAFREELVQLLHSVGFAGADAVHQQAQGGVARRGKVSSNSTGSGHRIGIFRKGAWQDAGAVADVAAKGLKRASDQWIPPLN